VTITFRSGTLDDVRAAYDVFVLTTADLERRTGLAESEVVWSDSAFVESYWVRRKPLFEHLTRTAEHFWVAESEGRLVGYTRATLRDGVRELTDFFVLPAYQAKGVGGELLARAFPVGGARRRTVIASTDIRALARYLKAGVYPRFPLYHLLGKPQPLEIPSDLTFTSVTTLPETLAAIREIDMAILGYARDVDHEFLLRDRRPNLYSRGEHVVGYGYSGKGTGPIALLSESDFPAVLARAETEAAARHDEEFGMTLPLINRVAVDHLLGRGFKLEDYPVFFMNDEGLGTFTNYVFTSPPFFI